MTTKKTSKLLKEMGAEVQEIQAVPETIKVEIFTMAGVQEVEAPKGITIRELKQILGGENSTYADKKEARQLTDDDVLTENTELYRVVIKANA